MLLLLIVSEFIQPALLHSKTTHNKYAKTTINIRSRPNTKSKICGRFYWNDKIKILQKINAKWYKIIHQDKIRYVAAKYLKKVKCKSKIYKIQSNSSFKSYEDGDCITNNISTSQGKLKQRYHIDYQTGVYMIDDRYCIALGQFYAKKVGTKVDLLLSHNNKTHILKCVVADMKAKKDTLNNHRIHKDGSVVEFIVRTSLLSKKTRFTGDVSYINKKFGGKIAEIRVYKEE